MKHIILAAAIAALPMPALASISPYCEDSAQIAVRAWQNHADGMSLPQQRAEMKHMCLNGNVPCGIMLDMVDDLQQMPPGIDDRRTLDKVFDGFYRGCMQATNWSY